MQNFLFIFVLLLLFISCKPKENIEPIVEPPEPIVVVPTQPPCEILPPAPQPFGWRDSTFNSEDNIIAFIHNPIAPDEVICMTEGNITGYNQLFNYNIVTKTRIPLANTGPFLPSLNRNGWIVYSSIDNNIFRIKTNGDSLKQVTNNFLSMCPKWDNKGTGIFYFQQPISTAPSSLVKVNLAGTVHVLLFPADLPHHAPFSKSDQVIYLKTSATTAMLIQRNLTTQQERELISGPFDSKTGAVHFNNLCVDNNDVNMYWSNDKGIFRCNIASLKVDTLLTQCPNYKYLHPLISFKPNELTLGMHVMKPVSTYIMLHQYKAMQLDLTNQNLSEVRIFPSN